MAARAQFTWLSGLALIATAHADPRDAGGLIWRAPAGCPDAAEVRARIEVRIGLPIERAVHGIAVDIAPEPEPEPEEDGRERRFVARIDLSGAAARVLTSASCDELTDAVAVVIARIAADDRQPPIEAPREPARPELAPRHDRVGVRALGITGIGALPGVGVGGELAGYALFGATSVELAAIRWLPGHRIMPQSAAGAVDARLDVVALRIGWRSEQLPLRGWISGELGSVQRAVALPSDGQGGAGRWAAVGAGFGVAWPMTPRVRLVGIIELAVPLEPARFLPQDGAALYRPDPVTVRSGLGLELGWP